MRTEDEGCETKPLKTDLCVLNVLANDIRVTSGELGEILGLAAASAAKDQAWLPRALMSHGRNENAASQGRRPLTTDRIDIHLVLAASVEL
ncbi:hypothetical protein F2P81_016841 [Scophthalmus maximus]|uniref:Uncharacterized protein n=1 Tax=Scophthalmus maximus TaxID=52904 RepID=A0A6A4SE60_SCOMX|nr:hypothetical protein F2P81_016841 [Scophthalmus maximus]